MNKTKRLEMLTQKQEDWKKRNIYVRGLPLNTDEKLIRNIFSKFGEIESMKIPKVENIRYENSKWIKAFIVKGVAYILFVQPQSAERAVEGMKNQKLGKKRLYVDLWKSKEDLAESRKNSKMMNKTQKLMAGSKMMPGQKMMSGRGRQRSPPGRCWAGPQFMRREKQQAFSSKAFPAKLFPPHQVFPVQAPIPSQQSAQPLAQSNFNIKAYEDAPPEVQKRMLGEALYPIVLKNSNPKIAGKITGMLLENENQKLILLLNRQKVLNLNIRDAINVLRRVWENDPQKLKLIES